jgi:hypothetical protein
VKPGYKTTEFWGAVIVGAAAWIASLQGALPERYAVYASAAVAGLYAVGRGLAKIGGPTA